MTEVVHVYHIQWHWSVAGHIRTFHRQISAKRTVISPRSTDSWSKNIHHKGPTIFSDKEDMIYKKIWIGTHSLRLMNDAKFLLPVPYSLSFKNLIPCQYPQCRFVITRTRQLLLFSSIYLNHFQL